MLLSLTAPTKTNTQELNKSRPDLKQTKIKMQNEICITSMNASQTRNNDLFNASGNGFSVHTSLLRYETSH